MADMQRPTRAWEISAGTGLGVLMGLLLGLSATGVIGSAIGCLAAMLAAFFGLARQSTTVSQQTVHVWRISSFGFACALAVVVGVEARTHNWLGASIQAQVDQWKHAGASSEDAVAYVAYQQLGIIPAGRNVAGQIATPTASGVLFASHDLTECAALARDRFNNSQNRLAAMRNTGDNWAKFTTIVTNLPESQLDNWLDAGYQLVCGG